MYDAATSGAEWWTQTIEPADEIGLHWDRDYDMQADQGLLIHPHVATVTYLCAPATSAPTVVLDAISPLLASESPCGPLPRAVACYPAAGRHLCFDGRKLHGAMLDLAMRREKPAGAKAKGTPAKPKRITFLVNVWFNHVPWGAEPLPVGVANKLTATLPSVQLGGGGGDSAAGKSSSQRGGGGRGRGNGRGGGGRKSGDAAVGGVVARVPTTLGEHARDWAHAKTHEWTFGDLDSRLTLSLPWPADRVSQSCDASGEGGAPLVELSFGGAPTASFAELRRAAPKSKAGAKNKKETKKETAKKRKR